MLCGATLFGAKRAHFAGVPTHSPPGNAGDASRHTRSKAPFPAPSVVHLPCRIPQDSHHRLLSVGAGQSVTSTSKVLLDGMHDTG